MNFAMIGDALGACLLVEAAFMAPALGIALFRQERNAAIGFIAAMLLLVVVGVVLRFVNRPKNRDFFAREGFFTVGFAWLLLSAFGAVPFCLSGEIPSFVDAFFETVSGFTTTGASILPEVESLPMSLLYWRSFTVWLGGMGVLVFVLAISPFASGSGEALHLLRAESPGVKVEKLVPRMRRSTSILYRLYLALSLLMLILLLFDLPFFDALTTVFATAGTGGFAVRNLGMAAYSRYSQTVITVFMLLFSVNFTVYYLLLLRHFRAALKNEELWVFFLIVAVSTAVVAWNIRPLYSCTGDALHHSAFTVASIISTAGFAISDFNAWPWLSKTILLLLMFVGACAGSTGGGMKVIRILLLGKTARRGIRLSLHPQEVRSIHMDGEVVDENTIHSVTAFGCLYFFLFGLLVLLLSLDGLDFVTTFSAAASCINNVGPGLSLVGPMSNYSLFSPFAKVLLSFAMLFGRLELYPMMVLFVPSAWRK